MSHVQLDEVCYQLPLLASASRTNSDPIHTVTLQGSKTSLRVTSVLSQFSILVWRSVDIRIQCVFLKLRLPLEMLERYQLSVPRGRIHPILTSLARSSRAATPSNKVQEPLAMTPARDPSFTGIQTQPA
jgi:hypothetical protein